MLTYYDGLGRVTRTTAHAGGLDAHSDAVYDNAGRMPRITDDLSLSTDYARASALRRLHAATCAGEPAWGEKTGSSEFVVDSNSRAKAFKGPAIAATRIGFLLWHIRSSVVAFDVLRSGTPLAVHHGSRRTIQEGRCLLGRSFQTAIASTGTWVLREKRPFAHAQGDRQWTDALRRVRSMSLAGACRQRLTSSAVPPIGITAPALVILKRAPAR